MRATGQKIVEYLMVDAWGRVFADPPDPPRDFAVTDAAMTLTRARLLVNGVEQSVGVDGRLSGAVLVFYVPGHGKFSASLAPHPEAGYVKAGEVRGESLAVTEGVDTFVLRSQGAIAPGGSAYNLYVKFEPGYRGPEPEAPFFGSQDRPSR